MTRDSLTGSTFEPDVIVCHDGTVEQWYGPYCIVEILLPQHNKMQDWRLALAQYGARP